MPFNILVTTCACSSQCLRYHPKKGLSITIDAEENEHVVFFEIDDKSNTISHFREHFGMTGKGEKICDLLIYYFAETKKTEVRKKPKILCLAESKGLPIDEAIEQIENTYNRIKGTKFLETDAKKYCNPIIWCAYIVSDRLGGASHSLKPKEAREKLGKIFGTKYCDVTKNEDIGIFLRECSFSSTHKK